LLDNRAARKVYPSPIRPTDATTVTQRTFCGLVKRANAKNFSTSIFSNSTFSLKLLSFVILDFEFISSLLMLGRDIYFIRIALCLSS
jgi:hypothetical protein